jgi:hypothetical protein
MKFDSIINNILGEELSDREKRIQALKSIKTPKREEDLDQDAEDILDDLWNEDGDGEGLAAARGDAAAGVRPQKQPLCGVLIEAAAAADDFEAIEHGGPP